MSKRRGAHLRPGELSEHVAWEAGLGRVVESQEAVIARREPLALRIEGRSVGDALSWEECWRLIDEAFRAKEPYNNQETWVRVVMKGADGSVLDRSIVAALWEACCEDPWLFHLHVEGDWVGTGSHDSTDRA